MLSFDDATMVDCVVAAVIRFVLIFLVISIVVFFINFVVLWDCTDVAVCIVVEKNIVQVITFILLL